ncbi:AraC family transcriptional regulator [Paenibacillus eucommiae]|uniref:Iron complex transport system substrate-binding protein n=1 Tax=Paenibacillus eucommiae TaxID=1355755 RepID=A0ABS4IV54_9BACL|nr:AraC family transcriptional regulator [Paenibacillus eucommiae]MBP1991458.1 iron complex transport system substrate-binding protein [Paenibacillus eucommiae]
MRLSEQLILWNQASIKLMDIRHITMKLGEEFLSYRLPASGFLFAVRGGAYVQLDGVKHQANRFHILHGGKGCCLDICPIEESFEYYMIYYKAMIPLPVRQEIIAMMERNNPFHMQHGFIPDHPASLLHKVQLMHREWEEQGPLERFHVKALFYQFVFELLWQIHSHHIPTIQTDLVAQAIRYMQEHYAQPITLDLLAEVLDSSPRHLTRLFKRQTGSSPIDYVIQIRMDKAKEMLLASDATLQEIAEGIGYPDSYYFAKMFKKFVGIAPIRYRSDNTKPKKQNASPYMPSSVARYDIVQKNARRYIGNGHDNHYQLDERGNLPMYRNNKLSLGITLLLCLTLLLSACSTGTAGNASNGGTQPTSQTTAAANASDTSGNTSTNQPAEGAAQPQTKTISTVKGDVEVPVNPQRVVVLYLVGDVLALGVKPIGSSSAYEGAAFEKEMDGTSDLGTWFEPSPEAVLALDPDVIIVPSEETYQMLKQIAPTVYIPYEKMSVDERLKQIGEVIGKEGESQVLLDNFYAKVEQAKKKLKEAGILDKTVTIMEGGKGSMGVVASKNYGRGSQVIYEYLGMKAPKIINEEVQTSDSGNGHDVSFELLADYAGDYVFRSSYEGMVDLSDNAIWNSIPAVKEGRLIEIGFGLSYYSDIYSLDKQLDFIVDSLLATVK